MEIDMNPEGLPPAQHPEQPDLDVEREKHRLRAQKFGVEYKDPSSSRRDFKHQFKSQVVAEQRAGAGFTTGFDLFTVEEEEKRQQRAARFNMPTQGIQWAGGEVAEDERKRRQRAERFGPTDEPAGEENGGLMDVDLFEDRKEAPVEAERRLEVVHIYGVDLLSTKDILNYFADYGPKYIEWINDSSANVVFNDAATAKRAMAGMGVPMATDDLPAGASLDDPQAMQYVWHKGKDFHKASSDIPLVFRIATVMDVKPAERVKSRRLWVGLGGGGRRGKGRGRGRGRGKGASSVRGGGVKKSHRRQSRDMNIDESRGRDLVQYDDL
jgi:hypothetical protein